jgi:hypothetical protein
LATKGEVTQEKLLSLFGVSPDSFLYSFAKEIAGFFSHVDYMEKIATIEDLVKYYDWISIGEFKERCAREIDLIEKGWTLYIGSASDEGSDDVERWICYETINFESDDLILESEGGY